MGRLEKCEFGVYGCRQELRGPRFRLVEDFFFHALGFGPSGSGYILARFVTEPGCSVLEAPKSHDCECTVCISATCSVPAALLPFLAQFCVHSASALGPVQLMKK